MAHSHSAYLVPTTGGKHVGDALEYAVDLAEELDAVVHILAIVDPGGTPMKFGIEEVAEIDEATEAIVSEIAELYGKTPVKITGDVRRGTPYDQIQSYVTEESIDLIVLAHQSETESTGTIGRETIEKLIQSAIAPTVIVPPTE